MTLEKWYEYPKAYDTVKESVFFDELKNNLVEVIKDYAGLGVEDEAQIVQQANTLFTSRIVPSKADWLKLEQILDILTQRKEFRDIWNQLFESAKPTLNIEDLTKIREFLDRIQGLEPLVDDISLEMPVPNITALTKPRVTSANNYQNSCTITWDIDASTLALKTGYIRGSSAPNEDVTHYKINIEAGSHRYSREFPKTSTNISHSMQLDWWSWFGTSIRNSSLNATLEAYDKRNNVGQRSGRHTYPSNVKMQAPIASYEVQYRFGSGNWNHLGTTSNKSYLWSSLPKQTGNYWFRVRGIDRINQYTNWVTSDAVYMEYIDYRLSPPTVTASPTQFSITATWTPVDKATHYDIWIGDSESSAKSQHNSSRTRWVTQVSSATRRIVFNGLNQGARYRVSVRARNHKYEATGFTHATTLKPVRKVETYRPTGNQVYNWGYKELWGHYTPSGKYESPHWHNGGNGSSTGCYQGEWVDGKWTGIDRWDKWGRKLRGGGPETYWAYHGQHWGNRMSFVYYDYVKMRNDLRGASIINVKITGSRRNSYHGHYNAHPMYLYSHKREFTTNIGSSSSSGGITTIGAKYYTVKSGDYLGRIASAYGVTVNQIKSWNGLTSDIIYPGQKFQVSLGTTVTTGSGGGLSDNSLNLYRADNRQRLGYSNQYSVYSVDIRQGAPFNINGYTIGRQLVNNIVNSDMKGIGMAILYGSNYTTPAGYYSQDLAYMSFDKGAFVIEVEYEK